MSSSRSRSAHGITRSPTAAPQEAAGNRGVLAVRSSILREGDGSGAATASSTDEHGRGKSGSRGRLLGAIPAVRKSFVVEFVSTEGETGITARIQPTERAATALVKEGFRPSEAILDLVSDLLVEIAREEEEEEGEDDP